MLRNQESFQLVSVLFASQLSTVKLVSVPARERGVPEMLVLKQVKSSSRNEVDVHQQLKTGICCPKLFDFNQQPTYYQLLMEHFPSGDLAKRIHTDGRGTPERVKSLALHLLEALDVMHRNLITHGDIKPLNVLCHEGGRFVFCDFGHARQHQCEDREFLAEKRNDLYALGCTLLEAMVGEIGLDFTSASPEAKERHLRTASGAVEKVLRGLLAEVPSQRLECRDAIDLLQQENTNISTESQRYYRRPKAGSVSSTSTTSVSHYSTLRVGNPPMSLERVTNLINTILQMQEPNWTDMEEYASNLLELARARRVNLVVVETQVPCCCHGQEVSYSAAVELTTCACIFCKDCFNSLVLSHKEDLAKGKPFQCQCGKSQLHPDSDPNLRGSLKAQTLEVLEVERVKALFIKCPKCSEAYGEYLRHEKANVTCTNCGHKFCTFCLKGHHIFSSCRG